MLASKNVEVSIQLAQNIDELKLEDSRIDNKTNLLKARLENVKNTFV